MFNRKKKAHSVDQKYLNNKIRNLSKWINEYEIQAYATDEMTKEIKELLLDVYNDDKDVREYFLKKYVDEFSEILNEKSEPKNIDCIFKEDVPFDKPEKTEFKKFLENRNNQLLEKEKGKKKNLKDYNHNWSENKKIENIFDDLDEEKDSKMRKRHKDKKDYLSEQKRNNSKIRDYAKKRYQMMNKYNSNFEDNNNIKLNKKSINISGDEKESKKKKDKYYYYKNPSIINFRKSNIGEKHHNSKKSMEFNIPRLLILNKSKENDKKGIKIFSINNIKPNLDGENNTNAAYINKKMNNRYKSDSYNDITIEKEMFLDNRLNKFQNLKKENLKNFYSDYDYIRNNEAMDDSSRSYQKLEDDYIEENKDEIKKINISEVNNKISGYGPKKVEINKEIILDNNSKDKNNEKEDPNKKSNIIHKKINITKYIEDNDEDKSLTQKIEKDVTTSKTNVRSLIIPKEAYINRGKGKNLKEIFNYNGKDKDNKYFEISYVQENEIFGIDPSSIDKIFQINSKNEESKVYNSYNCGSYNERRNERKKKLYNINYLNNKKKDYYNENNNKENQKYENNGKNKISEIKANIIDNLENYNGLNNNKEIKDQNKEIFYRKDNDYKNFSTNINVNRSNGMKYKDIIIEKELNNIENKNKGNYDRKNINMDERKTYDINYKEDNDSSNNILFGTKRKRFHRVIKNDK